ncbi:MAG: hypothetical protein OEM23_00850 [Gemmatimonadota bacterium]|nr:hypothetical protein [Gemmatimonadota bacterium]
MMRAPSLVCIGFVLCFALVFPEGARAQLISPGKLSSPHGELEGIRNCTKCHQLRSGGIAPERCLACHQPLARRIAAGSGLHRSADYEPCASCHQDHQGADHDLIRWEPERFDHDDVPYPLEGSHAGLECEACHQSPLIRDRQVRSFKGQYGALNRTFLGLDATCAGCHETDDPHAGGFDPKSCSDCHDQSDWAAAGASFDHQQTRYPLTGRHRSVECNACHRSNAADPGRTYGGLRFAGCADCHTDPHDGGMQAACARCHSTDDWNRVSSEDLQAGFDHDRVYPLEGAHAAADCEACHAESPRTDAEIRMSYRAGTGRAYPTPIADDCTSCHLDLHRGELGSPPTTAVCSDCHGSSAWYPANFGISRHDAETSFRLVGAHIATPCSSCHAEPLGAGQFEVDGSTCDGCHAATQPHGDQFADRGCDDCHGQASFRIADFDHAGTEYPLDGAHVAVACAECHQETTDPAGRRVVIYRPLAVARCSDCHGA